MGSITVPDRALQRQERALERSAPFLVFEFAPFEGVESFFFPASSTIVMTLLLG